jgi:hypothetical protein
VAEVIKVEGFQAVSILRRLREGTTATTARQRKIVFNGITDALKGLGLVESKTKVLGLYEGIDPNGNHWFMVHEEDNPAPVKELIMKINEARMKHGYDAHGLDRELTELFNKYYE